MADEPGDAQVAGLEAMLDHLKNERMRQEGMQRTFVLRHSKARNVCCADVCARPPLERALENKTAKRRGSRT